MSEVKAASTSSAKPASKPAEKTKQENKGTGGAAPSKENKASNAGTGGAYGSGNNSSSSAGVANTGYGTSNGGGTGKPQNQAQASSQSSAQSNPYGTPSGATASNSYAPAAGAGSQSQGAYGAQGTPGVTGNGQMGPVRDTKINADPNPVLALAYVQNLDPNGNVNFDLDGDGKTGPTEEVDTALQYGREFMVDPLARQAFAKDQYGVDVKPNFKRLATKDDNAGAQMAAAQVLSKVEGDVSDPWDAFAMVAANYKLDKNYNNGKLKELIERNVPAGELAKFDMNGVGDKDVETLSAVYYFGKQGYYDLNDVLNSGAIQDREQYDKIIGYVTGFDPKTGQPTPAGAGFFPDDTRNLQTNNFGGIAGPPRPKNNGGGGGHAKARGSMTDGLLPSYLPFLLASQMGGMGGYMPFIMQMLGLLMNSYEEMTGESFPMEALMGELGMSDPAMASLLGGAMGNNGFSAGNGFEGLMNGFSGLANGTGGLNSPLGATRQIFMPTAYQPMSGSLTAVGSGLNQTRRLAGTR